MYADLKGMFNPGEEKSDNFVSFFTSGSPAFALNEDCACMPG